MRFFIFLCVLASSSAYAADWEHAGSRGMMEYVVVAEEKKYEKEIYLKAIDSICVPLQFCHVMFWADTSHVPTAWPMTDEQKQAMTLEYFYNANSDEKIFTWNCDVIDDESCMEKGE